MNTKKSWSTKIQDVSLTSKPVNVKFPTVLPDRIPTRKNGHVQFKAIFIALILIVILSLLILHNTSAIWSDTTLMLTRFGKDENTKVHLLEGENHKIHRNPGRKHQNLQMVDGDVSSELAQQMPPDVVFGDKDSSEQADSVSEDYLDVKQEAPPNEDVRKQLQVFKDVDQHPVQDKCPKRHNLTMKDVEERRIPRDLYKVAPKVFDHFPKSFLEGYNSPCWKEARDDKEGSEKRVRCLPKVFIAGVAKCGTTDLYVKIIKHPEIIEGAEKEPSWWSNGRLDERHGTWKTFKTWEASYLEYLQNFARIGNRIHKLPENSHYARKVITVDASPSTFWNNIHWQKYVPKKCQSGPTYVTADVIRAVLPKSKIIAIFRNPTDRVYSDYIFTGRDYRSPKLFHRYIESATVNFDTCLNSSEHNLRSCVYKTFDDLSNSVVIGHKRIMMLMKGFYSVFAREWMAAFPRDQLMFIRFEDWATKCTEILPEIYRFLELKTLPSEDIEAICSKQNATKKKNSKGPMMNATRDILDRFYRDSRKELAEITGDAKFVWNEYT